MFWKVTLNNQLIHQKCSIQNKQIGSGGWLPNKVWIEVSQLPAALLRVNES